MLFLIIETNVTIHGCVRTTLEAAENASGLESILSEMEGVIWGCPTLSFPSTIT